MVEVFVFAIGAMAGSVANAVIYRLPKDISWAKGRSLCPGCKHELGFWDLIPLLSYLWLRGKCHYCHKNIGIRYFLVELIMAIGFTLITIYQFSVTNQLFNYQIINSVILCLIFWVTVVVAVMDWETRLVSEAMVALWAGLVVILNYQLIITNQFSISNFQNNLIGLAVAVVVIGGIWALSKGRAMGFGDVEIAVVMGFWLGWPNIMVGLWMAFVTGAVVGSWLLIKKVSKLKSEIAFGPFLVLGSWIGYIWGSKIIQLVTSN